MEEMAAGAHSSITCRYIKLHTHTNLKYTLSLLHTTFSLCDHTHMRTHTHTHTHTHRVTDTSHTPRKRATHETHFLSQRLHQVTSPKCVYVLSVCECVQDSPLPRRRPAMTHTREARSSPQQEVCWMGRRSARSAFPPRLPCCRTLVCASSPSHKSPGTG